MTDIGSRAGVGKAPPLHGGRFAFPPDRVRGWECLPSERTDLRLVPAHGSREDPGACRTEKGTQQVLWGPFPPTALRRSPGDSPGEVTTPAPREKD